MIALPCRNRLAELPFNFVSDIDDRTAREAKERKIESTQPVVEKDFGARYGRRERDTMGRVCSLASWLAARPLLTVSAVPRKQSPGSELAQRRGRPPPWRHTPLTSSRYVTFADETSDAGSLPFLSVPLRVNDVAVVSIPFSSVRLCHHFVWPSSLRNCSPPIQPVTS